MKNILLMLTLSISILFGYSGYYAPFEGSKRITQGWDGRYSHGYADSSGPYNGKKLAFALDVALSYENVLAVKDGDIVYAKYHSDFGYTIIIKHNDGLYSLYAHLSKIKISSGHVNRGNIIATSGYTGDWKGTGPHLHFQMQTVSTPISGMANSRKVDFQGFSIATVNRFNGSKTVTSKNHATNSSTSVPQSYFDGAGSVINNSTNVYGGTKDIAMMHPHSDIGWNSTVVFQWRQEEGMSNCKKLDIYAERDIGDVIIKSKSWDATSIQEAFKVRLGTTPITLSNSNSWTTLAVTTTRPLSTSAKIYAKCTTGYNDGGRVQVSKDMVDVGAGYFWSGTGSIISRINTIKFGTKKDYAVSNNGQPSLTSFQWDTTNCKKINISNPYFTSDNYGNATVDKKPWSADENSWEIVCNSLPCSINEYSSGYYILKVKSGAGAISGGQIAVKCE